MPLEPTISVLRICLFYPLWLLLALFCCLSLASAAAVTLTNSDAFGTTSFNTAGNWDNGQPPAPNNSYFVPAAYYLRTPTNQAQTYTFNGGSLTVAGALWFKMSNVVTVADLRLTNGTLVNNFAGGTPNMGRLAGAINVLTNGVIDAGGGGQFLQILASISGDGALTVRNPGGITFSASNSFSGPLTVAGTTLEIDQTASLKPSSLILQNFATSGANTVINIVRPGGGLNVGSGPAGLLRVGYRNSAGTNCFAVLDVSAQSLFDANVGEFSVGINQYNDSFTTLGNIYLATNNTVTATNVMLADSAYAGGGTSTLRLGSGSNYFNTPVMTIGGRKESMLLSLPTGGVFRLDNGLARADLNLCVQNFSTSSNPSSSADLSGGTFLANLDSLVIGQKSLGNTGGTTGSLFLGNSSANNINANTVVIGSLTGATSGSPAVQGTLTFGGGSFLVNSNVILANFDNGSGSATGVLNINGGIFSVAGDIVNGGGTSTLNLNAGLLDMKPAGAPTPGSITVDTLVLNGTITNALNVTATDLSGSGTIANPAGTVAVLNSLAPGGTGALGTLTIKGSVTLQAATLLEFQKTGSSISSDLLAGPAQLTYGGTLLLTNLSVTPLAAGDSLKLFDAAAYRGLFAAIVPNSPGPNLLWDTSSLTVNGTLKVVAVPALSTAIVQPNQNRSLNLTLSGTTGQLYSVLTSTNPALPLGQWPLLTNGVFSTTPLLFQTGSDDPQRFFVNASAGYTLLQQPLLVQASTKPTNAAWYWYSTRTLDNLPTPLQTKVDTGFDQYGGLLARQTNATGFFYPLKVNGRWWLVDPQGCLFLHRGLATISTVDSVDGAAALQAKFGTTSNWAAATTALLRQYNFNGAGAWSDATPLRAVPSPLVYTLIKSFLSTYSATNSGPGYPYVFDSAFAAFCDKYARQLGNTKTDPWLLGYFSDNELAFPSSMLTNFLSLATDNSSGDAAWAWLRARYGANATLANVTTQDKYDFLGYTWSQYYSVVSQAIKRYDPNHLYLGSRFYGSDKDRPEIFRAVGPYVDVLSVNHYSQWTPDISRIQMWERESGRPVLISEWYVKGEDSGMPNNSGAGWVVHTQHDRGLFYENFALTLLESKVVVGWHWFKYADNDPTDPNADPSNLDSNKGVVSNRYEPYYDLLNSARRINQRAHRLADYFDGILVP